LHAVDHCNCHCHECSHFSPFATLMNGKKDYDAKDYVPWIRK